jgi:hypothetical protein
MTLAPEAPGVLHLAHPRPVPWASVISVIAKELDVPLVPYQDWLRALEASATNAFKSQVDLMRANPALRLLPFYRGVRDAPAHASREAMDLPLMDTAQAQRVARLLEELAPLGEANVGSWMGFWKRTKVL